MYTINDNKLCVVHAYRTGNNLLCHDICQIIVLPLLNDLTIDKSVIPFCMRMYAPTQCVDYAQSDLGIKALSECNALANQPLVCSDLFSKWFDKLKLKHNHRIMPIAYDWATLSPFVRKWLGEEFEVYFDYRSRSLLSGALTLSDRLFYQGEQAPVQKYDLNYILKDLGAPTRDGTLQETALNIASAYKALIKQITFLR